MPYLMEMRQFMPPRHARLIADLEAPGEALRAFCESSVGRVVGADLAYDAAVCANTKNCSLHAKCLICRSIFFFAFSPSFTSASRVFFLLLGPSPLHSFLG